MPLTISDDLISGDFTSHTARRLPGDQRAWQVSWLPGRLLDRNSAITAMVLAEAAGSSAPRAGDRLWPHIEGWAGELGLTAPDALAQVSASSGYKNAEMDGAALPDREAGS